MMEGQGGCYRVTFRERSLERALSKACALSESPEPDTRPFEHFRIHVYGFDHAHVFVL